MLIAAMIALAGTMLGAATLVFARDRAYRRHLRYDPTRARLHPFTKPGVESSSLVARDDGWALPEQISGSSSALLEVAIATSPTGRIADPWIEIALGDFHDRQFVERGAAGTRYLNLTRMVDRARPGDTMRIVGRHLHVGPSAALHVSRERPLASESILVIAPHPDDAEIAAFGLYSDTRATVATITAGDAPDRYRDAPQLRVLDSLTVPRMAGLEPDRVLNLCYPDSRLATMRAEPDREMGGVFADARALKELRRLNASSLVRPETSLTWQALVTDLETLIESTRADIVVTPHPWLDPHSDHVHTTLAVAEAAARCGRAPSRFYFYVVHNLWTELWPFGPAGTGVSLLPLFVGDVMETDGFYSHRLSDEMQRRKRRALEAMHDVREEVLPTSSLREHARRARAETRAALHGMGKPPTSYLRRAVRPDELFFTASFARGLSLCDRVRRERLG